MKKLLFFNRFPIIDGFVAAMLSSNVENITIVRNTLALRQESNLSLFDAVLLNVDDRLSETPYLAEILRLKKKKIKIVVFGQYENQSAMLRRAGAMTFLSSEPSREEFLDALG